MPTLPQKFLWRCFDNKQWVFPRMHQLSLSYTGISIYLAIQKGFKQWIITGIFQYSDLQRYTQWIFVIMCYLNLNCLRHGLMFWICNHRSKFILRTSYTVVKLLYWLRYIHVHTLGVCGGINNLNTACYNMLPSSLFKPFAEYKKTHWSLHC